jgi:hypothetical protein
MKWVILGIIVTVVTIIVIFFKPAEKVRLLTKYYLNPCPFSSPKKQTDFPIYLEDFDIEQYYNNLLAFKDDFDYQTLATVSYADKSYPVYKITLKNSGEGNKLLIISATHGNEFATALVIPKLLEDISENKDFYKGWEIEIITPANPVGLVHQSRYNETGCDINRDFNEYRTIGAGVQRDVIEEFKPDVIVTMHESFREGFFVIAEQNTVKEFEQALARDLQAADIDLGNKSILGLPLSIKGISRKSMLTMWLQRVFNINTLGMYAHELGITTLTTESPWTSSDVEARIKPHLITVKSVVSNY